MENTQCSAAILDRIPSPAFLVENGTITQLNLAARQRQIPQGVAVSTILATGLEEYPAFQGGCLHLMVRVCDIPTSFSVTRIDGADLFELEQDADQAEFQTMALAAQALRRPLSNVMSVADRLFPLTCFDETPGAKEQVAHINRGLYQMLRIVCNMSDAYRYSTDTVFRSEVRDVGSLLEELFLQNAPLIEYAEITLRFHGLKESIYCLVDAEKLERAVGNMLSNAMKFTPKGGAIDAKLTRKGRMLYLTVQDNGSGIPDELKSRIYSRYQRQPGVEDSRFGIGLGMALIRSAAAAHGGTVLMEYGTDFGTRLTMTIPIRLSSDPMVRSPMIHVDYAGDRDHRLLELSDCLPAELFSSENIN